jgi:hypothetical protein
VALDELEDQRRAVLDRPREDPQQVAARAAVGQDAQLAQRLQRHAGLAGPLGERVVVAVRRVGELDAHLGHRAHGADDVRRHEREVPGVTRAMVDGLEVVLRVVSRLAVEAVRQLDPAGQERPVVPAAVDERAPGTAVRREPGEPHGAVLVGDVVRLLEDGRAAVAGAADGRVDVRHLERQVDDAVAVRRDAAADVRARAGLAGDDEARGAGDDEVLARVAVPGLGPAVGGRAHAERRRVPVHGLPGVADVEADVVRPEHRERARRVAVGHRPDQVVREGVAHAALLSIPDRALLPTQSTPLSSI